MPQCFQDHASIEEVQMNNSGRFRLSLAFTCTPSVQPSSSDGHEREMHGCTTQALPFCTFVGQLGKNGSINSTRTALTCRCIILRGNILNGLLNVLSGALFLDPKGDLK
eukprot:364459-Chlamydomonas_euryale.AAC.5